MFSGSEAFRSRARVSCREPLRISNRVVGGWRTPPYGGRDIGRRTRGRRLHCSIRRLRGRYGLWRRVVYTGRGGRDEATQRQIADQDFRYGNRALAHSSLHGLPVRVIRGWRHRSPHSPSAGYRYDGLYLVDDYWQERGRPGFLIWRHRLVKLPEQLDQDSTNH